MTKRKSMRSFIRENRDKITGIILDLHPDLVYLKSVNDDERRVMIKNEPVLSVMAKEYGVKV